MDPETEVNALRSELETATELVSNLREEVTIRQDECDTLRRNFESLKARYEAMQRTPALGERYDDLILQWKQQLEEKEREFDELQRTILPIELQKMRENIIEEMENAHRQQLYGMQQEAEKYREAYMSIRREFDSLLSRRQQEVGENERIANELQIAHEESLRGLQSRLNIYHDELEQTRPQLELLMKENKEMRIRYERLMDELREVRAQKEQAIVDREAALMSHATALQEEISKSKEILNEKIAVSRKLQHVEAQLSDAQRMIESMQSEVLNSEREQWTLKARAEADSQRMSTENEALKGRLTQAEEEMNRTRAQHHRAQEELKRRLDTLQKQNDEIAAQLTRVQADAQERIKQARDNELQATERMRSELTLLHSKLEDASRGEMHQWTAHSASLQEEIRRLTGDNQTLNLERQRLEERCLQLVQQVANLRADVEKKSTTLQTTKTAVVQLSKDNQDLTIRVNDLTATKLQYESKIDNLRKDIETLTQEQDEERREIHTYVSEIKDLRKKLSESKSVFQEKRDVEHSYSELMQQIASLKAEISHKNAVLQQNDAQIAQLTRESKEFNAKLSDLMAAKTQLEMKMDVMKRAASGDSDDEGVLSGKENLEIRCQSLKMANRKLKEQMKEIISAAKTDYSTSKVQVAELRQKCKMLATQIARIDSEKEMQRVGFELEIQQIGNKLRESERRCDQLSFQLTATSR